VDDFAVPLVAAGLWHLLGLRWPDESVFIDRSRAMMRRLWDLDGAAPMERLTGRGAPTGAAADAPPPSAEHLDPDDMLEELVLKAIERDLERDQGLLAALERTTWQTYFADRTLEIHSLAVGLVGAALVNTGGILVRAVEHLGTHPADRHTLLERRDRIAPAVEELLRLYPPQFPGRIVMRDTRLGGERLRVGDAVLASIREANRDTEVFSHPDRFILDRASKPHLSFGAGRHRCVGSSFARMVLAVALEELHAAVPHYRVSGRSEAIVHSPLRVPLRRVWVEPTPDRSAPA
jgi:cytochrome P450